MTTSIPACIVIEGTRSAGKSSVARLVADGLGKEGILVMVHDPFAEANACFMAQGGLHGMLSSSRTSARCLAWLMRNADDALRISSRNGYDLVIFDRHWLTATIIAESACLEKDSSTPTMPAVWPLPDTLFLHCTTSVTLARNPALRASPFGASAARLDYQRRMELLNTEMGRGEQSCIRMVMESPGCTIDKVVVRAMGMAREVMSRHMNRHALAA